MSVQTLFAISFRLIAAFFLLLLAVSTIESLLFLRGSVSTVSTVVGYREVQNYAPFGLFAPGDATRYFVQLAYRTSESEDTYTITATRGASVRQYEVGSALPIRYSVKNPTRGRINSTTELWARAIIFAIITGVFSIIGAVAPYAFRLGTEADQKSRYD